MWYMIKKKKAITLITLIPDSDIMSTNRKGGEFKHDNVHNGHSCQIR